MNIGIALGGGRAFRLPIIIVLIVAALIYVSGKSNIAEKINLHAQ